MYFEKYLEMEKTVKDILKEEKYLDSLHEDKNRFINMYNAYNDGKATERIFNLITDSKNNN